MITQEAYEYASSCSVYQTFRMSLTGQTHYLLLTATVFAIFPSRSGYIDQMATPHATTGLAKPFLPRHRAFDQPKAQYVRDKTDNHYD